MLREIHSADELLAHLQDGGTVSGLRLQGVDLASAAGEALIALPNRFDGLVVLGGHVPASTARTLTDRGAILFPSDPHLPIDPYRARLYSAGELYAGLTRGYAHTPDAQAYRWSRDCRVAHDAYAGAMRGLHDESMRDALHESLEGRRTVGIMGGHAMGRTSAAYAQIARLAHDLADGGHVVLTGGGPGAMEAANLGAADRVGGLDAALECLASVESFRPSIDAWAHSAFAARELLGVADGAGDDVRSVGIPTWFYGHEPPNVFGDVIAKFFSNALREDDLLAGASGGIIVLEGAAGTVQEIFQSVTRLYYAADDVPLPHLVLVGRSQWTDDVPVWPALTALAAGRRFADHLHLVETPAEAFAVLTAA
ncbi:LOG family protein [Dermacoccus nishinomiyaensis]|uniref:LOG family protein n=1 Tax=Dermacoccus nishinomiyaensis TaxID=1274 RepID=UPI001EF6E0B7|nr:Rossmann fold nucleotide-binding protein [Dermacoccus nishinomiyaensis]MCG7430780.1 Rossmann fold nucleotide-binding protein [Dermacoccus nishinomiyaensis]